MLLSSKTTDTTQGSIAVLSRDDPNVSFIETRLFQDRFQIMLKMMRTDSVEAVLGKLETALSFDRDMLCAKQLSVSSPTLNSF